VVDANGLLLAASTGAHAEEVAGTTTRLLNAWDACVFPAFRAERQTSRLNVEAAERAFADCASKERLLASYYARVGTSYLMDSVRVVIKQKMLSEP
jgi:hypothetical protein